VTRNGIASSAYGSWNGSFRFDAKPPPAAAAPTAK
jgi:hypothetical protein